MTPKEIVAELDKYIIGQDEAKKIRRHRSEKQIQEESPLRGNERRDYAEEHTYDGSYRMR